MMGVNYKTQYSFEEDYINKIIYERAKRKEILYEAIINNYIVSHDLHKLTKENFLKKYTLIFEEDVEGNIIYFCAEKKHNFLIKMLKRIKNGLKEVKQNASKK